MCGRFTSRSPVADVAAWFDVDEVVADGERRPRYNVAPTDEVLVVASSSDGSIRRLGEARWGLVPGWASGPEVGARMINARAETLLDKSAFRRSFARRRCIVPADGFYEWEHPGTEGPAAVGTGAAGRRKATSRAKRRQPWYIEPTGSPFFAFAGLWESWRPPGDGTERLVSCTIVTTAANGAIAALHGRMPVLLERDDWDAWLDPDNQDVAELRALLLPAPDDAVSLRQVGRAVGDVRNDGPELLEPPDDATGASPDPETDADPVLFELGDQPSAARHLS
ncbi:MAG TPA: SOS response-associated peptidase [Acidimicrobiales bacterium]